MSGLFEGLPPHSNIVLEHQPHALIQVAMGRSIDKVSATEAIAGMDPRSWVSPEQLAKAIATNSVWTARWMPPDCSAVVFRAAADLEALLVAICEDRR